MMIDYLKQLVSNKGKTLVVSVLLIASLWHPPVFAEQRYQIESLETAIAELGDTVLSDDHLDSIRGQGLKVSAPEHNSLAVILWDEGPTKKGSRSSLGNQVSTTINRVSVEGR